MMRKKIKNFFERYYKDTCTKEFWYFYTILTIGIACLDAVVISLAFESGDIIFVNLSWFSTVGLIVIFICWLEVNHDLRNLKINLWRFF